MKQKILLDTGPLVAFLNSRDKFHEWTLLLFGQIEPPLLTCEAVLSEACFLLALFARKQDTVLALLKRGILHEPFRLTEHTGQIERLLQKYQDIPMSLADACLVRMAEIYDGSTLLTLDTDFKIYRKHRRHSIPAIFPPDD